MDENHPRILDWYLYLLYIPHCVNTAMAKGRIKLAPITSKTPSTLLLLLLLSIRSLYFCARYGSTPLSIYKYKYTERKRRSRDHSEKYQHKKKGIFYVFFLCRKRDSLDLFLLLFFFFLFPFIFFSTHFLLMGAGVTTILHYENIHNS